MRKAILAALIALMIAAPCLAQEINREVKFSVDGTLWGVCEITITSMLPFFLIGCGGEMGFYQGQVYSCTTNYGCGVIASYIDLGVVSIAWDINLGICYLAIMQPFGLGVFSWIVLDFGGCGKYGCNLPFFGYTTGIIYKIEDNWTPPEVKQDFM